MNTLVNETNTVKLTLATDGKLWIMRGRQMPELWSFKGERSTDEMVGHVRKELQDRPVRIPGLFRNIALINFLLALRDESLTSRIEICSPWCCGQVADTADPGVLLYSAQRFDPPVSVGGWRRLTDYDRAVFKFSEALQCGEPIVPEHHPVLQALSWIRGINLNATAYLLGMIVDPRWFIDPARPDRHNKLSQFLGLAPIPSSNSKTSSKRFLRSNLVRSCWRTSEEPPEDLQVNDILWQKYLSRPDQDRAEIETSRFLVSWLRQMWLAVLCRSEQRRELFVPSLFFSDPETAEAFSLHWRFVLDGLSV